MDNFSHGASFTFLKKPKADNKIPYVELDDLGFGHKEDQLLSPKLQQYMQEGKKFSKQNISEKDKDSDFTNSVTQADESKTLNSVTYGKYEYSVLGFLKDESEDEEE